MRPVAQLKRYLKCRKILEDSGLNGGSMDETFRSAEKKLKCLHY